MHMVLGVRKVCVWSCFGFRGDGVGVGVVGMGY